MKGTIFFTRMRVYFFDFETYFINDIIITQITKTLKENNFMAKDKLMAILKEYF